MRKKKKKVFIRFKADQEQGRLVGTYVKVRDQHKDLTLREFYYATKNHVYYEPVYKNKDQREGMDFIIASPSFPEYKKIKTVSEWPYSLNNIGPPGQEEFTSSIQGDIYKDWIWAGANGENDIFYINKEKDLIHRYVDATGSGSQIVEDIESTEYDALFFNRDKRVEEKNDLRFIVLDTTGIPAYILSDNGLTLDSPVSYIYHQGPEAVIDLSSVNWELAYVYFAYNIYYVLVLDYQDPANVEPGMNPQIKLKQKILINQDTGWSPPIELTPVYKIRETIEKTTTPKSLNIKVIEKKYNTIGECVNTDEICQYSYNKPPDISHRKAWKWGAMPALYAEPGDWEVEFDYGEETENRSSSVYILLSYHLAIFYAEEYSKGHDYQFDGGLVEMQDEKGTHRIPNLSFGGSRDDYIKVISESTGYTWGYTKVEYYDQIAKQFYFSEGRVCIGSFSLPAFKPMIIKKNDEYVFMVSDYNKCFILKDGVEYVLPIKQDFEINGVKIPVEDKLRVDVFYELGDELDALPPQFADFVFYFQSLAMNNCYLVKHDNEGLDRYHPDFREDYVAGIESLGLWGYFNQVYTWFGDYIYKVRTDEFYDGTFFFDEVIKRNYPKDHRAFLLDLGKEWKRDFKIYRPETKELWVEKYKVTLDGSNNTAKIDFVRRFTAPFTPPVEEIMPSDPYWLSEEGNPSPDPMEGGYTSMLTQLYSISYIP